MKTTNLLRRKVLLSVAALAIGLFVSRASWWSRAPKPGTVLDEAKQAGLSANAFPAAADDYFHDMDGGASLTTEQIKGRNTWIVWTGGNDRFWDHIGASSFGALDFLKTISSSGDEPSEPRLKFSRDNRWKYLGLVNEPCYGRATGPDPKRFGLWLDQRSPISPDCPPDPFASEEKYPGVKIGARGKDIGGGRTLPVGSYYGEGTGIVGLRLFPNPDFDAAAAAKWDPVKFYNDPSYYNSKDLVRPYRVGMSCSFCHVGPNPINPPADPEHPKWENLSSNVGAQYFWIDRIFDWAADENTYIFQMFHTSRPGALDTSLVSTDNINNPRTMNAIYALGPRLTQAKRFGQETLGGGSLNNKQLNDYVPADSPLAQFFVKPATVFSPRVLKDGADSVGALGALNRVYLNIGLFSEEWLLHFNPLVGGKRVSPIEIAVARRNSVYWEATEKQTPDMALFFLATTAPHKLKDAPGGMKYLNNGQPDDPQYVDTVNRGKIVFAETCARCHSSKLPVPAPGLDPGGGAGPDYLTKWNEYWKWTNSEDFKAQMREMVMAPDFLEDNLLSAEHRVPVTLLRTNACSPLATNAIRDNIWDNFSSETYKDLPSVGTIRVYDPATGEPQDYSMPAGGRGYTRPASLVSLWSTAPFLLNNTVGRLDPTAPDDKYNPAPTTEKRMAAFEDGIEKMLWPEKREKDSVLAKAFADRNIDDFPGVIDRTTKRSYIVIKSGFVPDEFKSLVGWGEWIFPSIFGEGHDCPDDPENVLERERGDVVIGPIPPGTPVSLLANLELRPDERSTKHVVDVVKLLVNVKRRLRELGKCPTDEQAQQMLTPLVEPLMKLSKCSDYIVNRGHYFGTSYVKGQPGLSDADKRALIEFLKTF